VHKIICLQGFPCTNHYNAILEVQNKKALFPRKKGLFILYSPIPHLELVKNEGILLYNTIQNFLAITIQTCYNTVKIKVEEGVDVMGQLFDLRYKWENEGQLFAVSDVDKNFFLCRYLDSRLGFVIDKQVFHNHLSKGKIQSYTEAEAEMAV
jgi:hypothetical protein